MRPSGGRARGGLTVAQRGGVVVWAAGPVGELVGVPRGGVQPPSSNAYSLPSSVGILDLP
jgi:hypothetical protein